MAALSVQSASGASAASGERRAQLGVRGDASDDGDPLDARRLRAAWRERAG